jgi:hypothetical protein
VIEGRGRRPDPKKRIVDNIPEPKMTKIRDPPVIAVRPEPILSEKTNPESVVHLEKSSETVRSENSVGTKRQFVFSNDNDLDDLDDNFDDAENVVPPKKTKLDKNLNDNSAKVGDKKSRKIDDKKSTKSDEKDSSANVAKESSDSSFSISQDFPTTSTQIEINVGHTMTETSKTDRYVPPKSLDISPLSNKTLSKLRAFLAPPKDEDDVDRSSKTDEGNGTSIVDRNVANQTSIVNKNVTNQTSKVDRDSSVAAQKSKNVDVGSSKISVDEGNGSSMVDSNVTDQTTNIDTTRSSISNVKLPTKITRMPSVGKNSVVSVDSFRLKMPGDVQERQRSVLASLFSDPADDNFDDLEF